jgi:hypothetical protein
VFLLLLLLIQPNLEIRKRKLRWIGHTLRKEDGEIEMDRSHTKKRGWGNTKGHLAMESRGKQEEQRIAGEDQLSKKRVEAGMN